MAVAVALLVAVAGLLVVLRVALQAGVPRRVAVGAALLAALLAVVLAVAVAPRRRLVAARWTSFVGRPVRHVEGAELLAVAEVLLGAEEAGGERLRRTSNHGTSRSPSRLVAGAVAGPPAGAGHSRAICVTAKT